MFKAVDEPFAPYLMVHFEVYIFKWQSVCMFGIVESIFCYWFLFKLLCITQAMSIIFPLKWLLCQVLCTVIVQRRRMFLFVLVWMNWCVYAETAATCNICRNAWQWPLQWRHNGRDSVSNHQPHDCLLNRLFSRRSKKTSKIRVTDLCAGNSPVTGEFRAQMASNAENVSIWCCHHDIGNLC